VAGNKAGNPSFRKKVFLAKKKEEKVRDASQSHSCPEAEGGERRGLICWTPKKEISGTHHALRKWGINRTSPEKAHNLGKVWVNRAEGEGILGGVEMVDQNQSQENGGKNLRNIPGTGERNQLDSDHVQSRKNWWGGPVLDCDCQLFKRKKKQLEVLTNEAKTAQSKNWGCGWFGKKRGIKGHRQRRVSSGDTNKKGEMAQNGLRKRNGKQCREKQLGKGGSRGKSVQSSSPRLRVGGKGGGGAGTDAGSVSLLEYQNGVN